MNKRIKELAAEATSWYTERAQGAPVAWEWEEKFAELIVRECMTICKETQANYFKHRKVADDFTDKNIYAEGEAASDIIKYKIKKHFGVA